MQIDMKAYGGAMACLCVGISPAKFRGEPTRWSDKAAASLIKDGAAY